MEKTKLRQHKINEHFNTKGSGKCLLLLSERTMNAKKVMSVDDHFIQSIDHEKLVYYSLPWDF